MRNRSGEQYGVADPRRLEHGDALQARVSNRLGDSARCRPSGHEIEGEATLVASTRESAPASFLRAFPLASPR
jgi:hypothetical protein